MLEIQKITKKYRKGDNVFTALDEVSLKVDKGDFIAVVGPSGSGKSTLLHTAGGLIRPDTGKVFFNGNDIYSLKQKKADEFRKKNVGFVFQQFHLLPYLSVYENIYMVCSNPSCKSEIDGLLEKCSLESLKNKYPSELSVGEKQRAAFIRAIITNPDILLADEPTGNLDPENSSTLMSLIADFNNKGGTVLLVSHDAASSKYATRQIKLQSGKLV
jgi:putative ABC transport system ATP-binding protein